MVGFAEQVVDGVDVEVEFADVFGLGAADLQLEDDESAQAQVEEQQVEVVLGGADGEFVLASDEGKAATELAEEVGEPADEGVFEFAFAVTGVEAEEVECLTFTSTVEWASVLVLYAGSAVLAYGCALLGVWWVLAGSGDDRRAGTVLMLAVLLPVGALTATAAGVGAAGLCGYSTVPATFVCVVAVVAAVVLARVLTRASVEDAGTG